MGWSALGLHSGPGVGGGSGEEKLIWVGVEFSEMWVEVEEGSTFVDMHRPRVIFLILRCFLLNYEGNHIWPTV